VWLANATVEIRLGTHTPAHRSPTVLDQRRAARRIERDAGGPFGAGDHQDDFLARVSGMGSPALQPVELAGNQLPVAPLPWMIRSDAAAGDSFAAMLLVARA
jgi:hypothetical protein